MKILDFKKILRYFNKYSGWKITVVAFLALSLLLIIINYYIYSDLEKNIARPFDAEVEIQTLKRELLAKVLSDLREKEKRFEQSSLLKPEISDPSS